MVKLGTQVTVTVTLAVATPDPFATVQIWVGAAGWVSTVTAYAPVTAVLKVKEPLAGIVRLSPPLSCKTKPVPVRPETVTPMVAFTAAVVQATATLVTLAEAVPVPPVTTQFCAGPVG